MKFLFKIAIGVLTVSMIGGLTGLHRGLAPAWAKEKDALLFVTFGDHPPYHSVDINNRVYGFDVGKPGRLKHLGAKK